MHHADHANFGAAGKRDTLVQAHELYVLLAQDSRNWVANLANCALLVYHAYHALSVPVNWAGFYVRSPLAADRLVLGPFMGKVACQEIRFGDGVCGAAATQRRTQLVPDVHRFPGHIACDGETQLEIVVPIVSADGVLRGVLDIDCLALDGFTAEDQALLEQLCASIAASCDWDARA